MLMLLKSSAVARISTKINLPVTALNFSKVSLYTEKVHIAQYCILFALLLVVEFIVAAISFKRK